ncbi:hypothetical protein MAC_05462 [Metarhizium acridum CQMa 102]|uniref:Uncharacterized protein n=1 Tax=Metarhizium acridum (strain CQMa 102) TaxID=655827 RepID=E9E6G4_METAQ|nr:uncharacterized protein MAC_05462 [Metarhizium acridum CQMa 102]EFY88410.1 hypothetical protein MAC_05462 [Metarhizium acridum CQMa 102]
MLLSSAAVVLGALQPALGKPSLLRRQMDGTKNEVVNQRLAATEIVIDYLAPNPPCGPYSPWVGIWPADACNSFAADPKAWAYVKPTKGRDIGNVKLNLSDLDVGEYRAAFVCEDGKRQAWIVSQPFKVDKEAPPAKKKQGERCYEADDCGDGLFCEHQCGGPIENYKSAMCFIAGEPKCRPIGQEQPAKKKQGERCSQVNECGDGLFCRHPCGGAIDDESNVCLIGGEPTCAPVRQEQPAKKKQGERCYKADDCDHGLFCEHQCGGAIDDPRPALCLIAGEPTCAPVRQS